MSTTLKNDAKQYFLNDQGFWDQYSHKNQIIFNPPKSLPIDEVFHQMHAEKISIFGFFAKVRICVNGVDFYWRGKYMSDAFDRIKDDIQETAF